MAARVGVVKKLPYGAGRHPLSSARIFCTRRLFTTVPSGHRCSARDKDAPTG